MVRLLFANSVTYVRLIGHPNGSNCFSTDPKWTSQQFTFVGFLSDILEVEVKDKFARSRPIISRFLGKRKILLASLLHRATPR